MPLELTRPAATGTQLLPGYLPMAGAYDEMVDANGRVRPHWEAFASFLDERAPGALAAVQREALRRLKEQGVHYHVYDDPEGMRRPWQLDPLPLLLAETDWQPLEAGLAQRARLFSLLLQDLYGPQRMLREKLLPYELIYRHPEFLRLARNTAMSPLTLFASDMARGPDGQWWVLSDRAQGPSGAGYVLEARMITKRVLGASLSDYAIAPLAQFFSHFKRHLATLAPDASREPTIALLSSGIGNEVYFEHAYMAAQLGITLVQGDDLTVRQGKVYLKTVDDLRQVDVLIRRVDSSYCDPLALRAESMLGVPGLLQAQALGKVGMANPIGSGILECPALLPFLPGLAKALLGEELLLPNVATWWCGQPKELAHVLERLPALVIKRTDRAGGVVFADQLSKAALERLRATIRAEPWNYLGQERVSFSTAPTLAGGGGALEPRNLILRTFLAGNGEHYDVMPGGLTRVAPSTGTLLVSSQGGSWSKDTWVLRERGSMRDALRLHPAGQRRTAPAVLTSRAAENLFWSARYLERCEALLRLVRSYMGSLELYNDYGYQEDTQVLSQLLPLLRAYAPTDTDTDAATHADTVWDYPQLNRLLLARELPGSLVSNLHRALDGAYTVRDLWPVDSWRALEEIEALVEYAEKNRSVVLLEQVLQRMLNAVLAFWGAAQESLALTQGGLWLHLGRRIERVHGMLSNTAAFCEQLPGGDDPARALEALLDANSCVVSHRRRYGSELSLATVWLHLLLEPTNPRSLLSQLEGFGNLLRYLNPTPLQGLSEAQRRLLGITTPLQLASVKDWNTAEECRERLAPLLRQLAEQLAQLGSNLEHRYFQHTQPFTQLG
ncbi:MAG: circularly permuted type 2 ATP-grasp protein [Spongiibacteraceae bacterium]|jgi:uncharacterized circularly permuted ATP-grasp superfamily protein/uncharacterized alpha-E superfamily protein|nr:circularly permuted type 2 ATP-grasp protein [Spongiibacteraceae bacterium]